MIGMDQEVYDDIIQILTEKFAIDVFTRFGNYFVYLLIGDSALPVNDAAELNRARLPGTKSGDWSISGLPIFTSLGYWCHVFGYTIREFAEPYLKFDELTIAITLGAEFVFLAIDWGVDYAIGYVVTSLPWAILLWFVFDGDMSEQSARNTD